MAKNNNQPPEWMVVDGTGNTKVVKEDIGWYRVYPDGRKELLKVEKTRDKKESKSNQSTETKKPKTKKTAKTTRTKKTVKKPSTK